MNDLTTKEEGKPLLVLANKFDAMLDRFENILPPHVTPQRFKQVVMTAVAGSPDVMTAAATNAGQHSILMESLKCASDGLIPDGREAALVAFNMKVSKKGEPDRWEKRVKYMAMVRGIITKMQQSPGVKDVNARGVYEKELEQGRFTFVDSDEESRFHHEPILFGDRGPLVGVYAYCRMHDGGFYFAPLNLEDLAKIEATSKGNNTPWKGPFKDQMELKSALKRLSKIAPMSREVQAIIDHDNETFHEIEAIPEKPSMLSRLQSQKTAGVIEAPPSEELPATDEPEPMTGELMEPEPEFAEALPDPCSQKQAITYAEAWSKHYKALDKAGRDAFYNATETDADRATKTASKAQDLISDAINSPPVE